MNIKRLNEGSNSSKPADISATDIQQVRQLKTIAEGDGAKSYGSINLDKIIFEL